MYDYNKTFKIENVDIYGLEQSARAAGFPMDTEGKPIKSIDRLVKLGKAKPGSGHDCALKGVTVQADINAPQYWWPQFQRYHFADIVSSQSKMHRAAKFNIEEQCNKYVGISAIHFAKKYQHQYNARPTHENYMKLLSNLPMGFNLTARITTNYLQLKTIHNQRRHHKLDEWQQFCDWVEDLPLLEEILKNK